MFRVECFPLHFCRMLDTITKHYRPYLEGGVVLFLLPSSLHTVPPPLLGPEAQPARPETQPARPEAQPARPEARVQTPSWISLKYPNPGQYFSKIYKRAFLEPWNGLHKPLTTRAIGTKRMCWLWLLKMGLKLSFYSLAERK